MEEINTFFGRLFDYLREHPRYGLAVSMILVLVYLIGLIFNWKWTLTPGSSSDLTPMWIDTFGEKTVRIFKGALAVISLVALMYMYFQFNH